METFKYIIEVKIQAENESAAFEQLLDAVSFEDTSTLKMTYSLEPKGE